LSEEKVCKNNLLWIAIVAVCSLVASMLLNAYLVIENQKLLSNIQEENEWSQWQNLFSSPHAKIIKFEPDGKWHYWESIKENNNTFIIHYWIGEVLPNGTIVWHEWDVNDKGDLK
jgi:hypothetical protein